MYRRQRFVLALAMVIAVSCSSTAKASAQALTPGAVEQYIRAWFDAFDSNDATRIVDIQPRGGAGFGYRTREPRPDSTKEELLATCRRFFESLIYYRVKIDEIHTAVDGDVGVAWGYYTEEFQARGRPPERVRARFSQTLRRDASGWRSMFYHRDAQPFDDEGRYIPVPRQ